MGSTGKSINKLTLRAFRDLPAEDAAQLVLSLDYTNKPGMNSRAITQTLVDLLGMHDKPTVLTDDDFDSSLKTQALDGQEYYRGFGEQEDSAVLNSFKFGDATYIGNGLGGDGIYITPSKHKALRYGDYDNVGNSTLTMFVDKNKAKAIKDSDLLAMFAKESDSVQQTFRSSGFKHGTISAYALYKGYNMIMQSSDAIVLDRGILVVRDTTKIKETD